MLRLRLRLLATCVTVLVAACEVVAPTNPFDPEAPPDVQAPASLTGRIVLEDPFDATSRELSLSAIRVGLLNEDGRRREAGGVEVSLPLVDITTDGEGRSSGRFVFDSLPAGNVGIAIDRAPGAYQAPSLPTVRLLPGGDADIGELIYTFVGSGEDGPGRITGEVTAEGGAGGQHRVTLFQRRGNTVVLSKSVITDRDFAFDALGFGTYAVVVESDGLTPVYRLGVEVAATDEGEARLQHQFAGEDALVVHPITSVLLPDLVDPTVILDEGLVFVRGTSVPLLVLPFVASEELQAEVGITGMRLSTSSTFVDDAGTPLPFVVHQAKTSVNLPANDGATPVFAQFEARSADNAFVFVSPTVSVSVTKDTTPPSIVDVLALGLASDGAGGVLSRSRTVNLRIDATDATSGIDAIGVAFDDVPAVLDDVTATPGLQRLQRSLTAGADGQAEVVLIVEDRAGNRSDAVRLPVTVDTVLPDTALRVVGAADGFLRSRVATVEVTSLIPGDENNLLVAVGLEGAVNEADVGPVGQQTIVLPGNLAHGASITFEAVVTDVVGNRQSITQTVTLDLRGSLSGAVVSDAVPAIVPSVAGATVTLRDSRAVTVGVPVVVDAAGDFTFPAVPEGAGYTVAVALLGHTSTTLRNIAIFEGTATDLGDVSVSLARGEVRGRALRSDVESDGTAHGGITVSLRLVSTSGRTFTDTVTTDAAGSYAFRNVPQTLAGESLELAAQAPDYGSATSSVSLDSGLVQAPNLLLPRARGDFDVCRTADAACAPTQFFSADSIDVKLRDVTDVVAVHVATNGGALERLLLGPGNRTTVSVASLADGEVVLSVQAEKSDGSRSEVLSATIVRDTEPPTGVSVVRRANPLARDPRFTNGDFVDVTVDADAGTGVVSPLGAARLVVANSAPPLPATGFVACAHSVACRVTLPNQERLLRVFAFSCDVAGNCAVPEETFVIRDTTAPSSANGVAFRVTADGSVVEGGVTILASPLYAGVIDTGVARTVGGVPVVDETSAGVADVFGFRFSLTQANLQNALLQAFADPPLPGETRDGGDIVVPSLPAGDAERTIFAQLVDAAGNLSQEAFAVRVLVDTDGPIALLTVNAGLPTASVSVPFALVVPPGAEAPRRLEFVVDNGLPQRFTLPLGGTERLTLPAIEGLRRIVMNAFDRVDNVTRVEQTIVLDQSGPRVDSARCSSATTCVDTGFGELLTNAGNARIDLAITTFDAFTSVATIEVSSVPAVPGGLQTFPVSGGTITGVLVAANTTSTLSLVPIDAVGNRGAALVRAVRHDVTGPVIASVTIEGGAARTNKRQVTVQIAVPAGDATALRLSATPSFSGPTTAFRTEEFFSFASGDGDRQVCVEVQDAAGNASNACDTIFLDSTPPAGTLSAPALTSAATVNGTLTYPADTVQVALSTAALTCDPATTPYITASGSPQTVNVALAGGDGERTLFACFRDGAGNISQQSTGITVDRTAPVATLTLNGGASLTTNTTPTALVTVSETVPALAFTVDQALSCASASFGAFTSSPTVTLPSTQGPHIVRVCVRDAALNVSAQPAVATITLDDIPPSGTVAINGGATVTGASTVTVSVAASSDTTQFAVANAATLNCATASYVSFTPTSAHQLTPGDGVKQVSVCLKDAAGQVSSSILSTITVDTTAPTAVLTVAGGADTTSIATVSANLSGVSEAVTVFVTSSPIACDTAPFAAIGSGTFEVTLSFPNTANVVTACVRDLAGNISTVTDSIFFENAAGDALIVAIDAGAATTRSRNVTVSLFRPSTEFNQMKVAEAPTLDCANLAGYEAFNGTKALALTAGTAPAEGQRTVSACVRSTTSGLTRAATDAIFVDTFAPDGSIVVNGGAVTNNATVTATLTNTFAGAGELVTVALSEVSTIGGGGLCTGSFEAFAAARTFTFTGADSTKTLFACFRDSAGNTREVQDSIILDRTPPSPVSITVPALTSTPTITVSLLFPADAVQVAVAEGALDCQTTQTYAAVPGGATPSVSLTLSAADGSRSVAACFKDAAGNTSQATATTNLDRSPPTGTVVLDGGALFSTDLVVSVAIANAADAVRMARVESATAINCAVQTYVAFVSPQDFTVSAADGTKTIQVCVEDAAGNRALALQDAIIVDRTAPNGTVVVNDGAAATSNRNVTLAIGTGVHTDVDAFAAAEGAITCNASNLVYQPFASLVPFLLSSSDASKTVLVCLKDQAGNVSTVAATDAITLDGAAPLGGAVSIVDGDGFLNAEATVALTVSWTTAGDVAAVKVGEGAVDCQSPSGYVAVGAVTSTSIANFPVSAGDGTKLVLACLKDGAGNVATAQDTTVRDTTAPVVTSVVCTDCVNDDGTIFSRLANVVLAVTSDEGGSGLASARVAVDAGAEVAATLVNGTVAVSGLTQGSRVVRVKLVDRAGNPSTVSRDVTIVVDQTAPALTQLLLAGDNAVGNATNNRTVAVSIVGASADTAQMAVVDGPGAGSQIPSCATATYAPFVPEFARTLQATDGAKAVSVCLKDRAGNTSAVATTTSIILDTVPVSLPGAPVAILDGDGFLQAETTVTVRLNWVTNGDARFAKVQEGLVDCASPAGYVALPVNANTFDVATVAIGAGDGQKLVGVCFKDAAANVVTAQASTIRDNTAPVVTSVVCPACVTDNGTLFSRSTTTGLLVTAIENGSGIATARVVRNGGASVTLAVGGGQLTVPSLNQGANTIQVKLADNASNITGDADDVEVTVTVDTVVPNLAAGGLRLNGLSSGGSTSNALVTATIVGAPADAVAMSIVEVGSAPNCTNATYVPLTLASSLQLSSGEGTKQVFACLRDRAGNTSSAATQASIVVDTVPPSLPVASVTILDGGDEFLTTVVGGVSVRLNWNTANDVVAFKLGENTADCQSEPYERPVGIGAVTTVTKTAFPLSPVDGTKLVVVCFKDAAGNVSTGQDTTELDQIGPNGAIAINDGSAFTTDVSENIVVTTRMATDVSRFSIVETVNPTCSAATLNCAGATYESFTATLVNGQLQAQKTINLSGGAAAGQGLKCIEACFEDGAGNRTSAAIIASITFDTQAPTVAAGNVILTGTPSTTVSRTPFITVTVTGQPTDTASFRVSEDSTFGGGAQAFTTFTSSPQPFLLSSNDGTKTVFVQLRDQAGNVGAATQKTISLDATPPENVSVTLNAGDAFATSATVTLTLQATGANEMQIAVDGVPDTEPFVAFAASAGATLVGADGPKTVAVRFRDAAGNTSASSDSIVLDGAAPSGGSVVINDGAAVTNNTTVSLAITPPADAATMSIGGGPFVAVSTVALTAIAAGDCVAGVLCKSVTVVFRDAAGNSGVAVADTVSLDTVPPSSVSVALVSATAGAASGFSTGLQVNASFAFATGAGNATTVKHGEGAVDCATPAGYVNLGATSPFAQNGITLSSSDGQKTYVACFKDAAGNVSSASTSITVDRQLPTATVAVAGNAAKINTSSSVPVTITAGSQSADTVQMAVRDVTGITPPVCTDAGYSFVTFSSTTTVNFLNAVNQVKTVAVCLLDGAGNRSAPLTDTVTLDTSAPTATLTVTGTIASGASTTLTGTPVVTAAITAASADVTELRIANEATFAGVSFGAASPLTRTHALTNGDGSKTVFVELRDDAGNVTTLSRSITLDTTPPLAPVIDAVAAFARTDVPLTWAAADADTSQFQFELLRAGASVSVTTSALTSRTLRAGTDLISASQTGVLHSVRIRAIDAVGNTSPAATVAFTFDTAAPCQNGSGRVVTRLNNNAGFVAGTQFTSSGSTLVQLGCNGELPVQMRFNCDGSSLAAATFVSFQDVFTCALNIGTQGTKQIAVGVVDAAGNESVATVGSIFFDNVSPTTPRFTATGAIVGSASVTLSPLALQSTDPNGASGSGLGTTPYEVRATNITTPLIWDGTSSLSVSLAQGDNAIRVRAVDRSLNASDEDLIIVNRDGARPSVASVVAEPGNGDVLVRWTTPDVDVTRFEVLYGPVGSNTVTDYTGSNADQGFSPLDVGTATSVRLTGMPNGTPVFVAVRAFDAVGAGGLTRQTASVTPNEVPLVQASATASGDAGRARGVASADGIAFVVYGCDGAATCTSSGIRAFDVSDPANPTIIGSLLSAAGTFANALDIVIQGDSAYVSDGTIVRVVNIQDPTAMSVRQNLTVPNAVTGTDFATALAVRPGQLFVAAEQEGLLVYDITGDTGTLTLRDACHSANGGCMFGPGIRAVSVAVQGDFAYVGNGDFITGPRAVEVVDVTLSTAISRFSTGEITQLTAWDLEFHGRLLYLAQNGQLRVHDISGTSFTATLNGDAAIAKSSGQPINVVAAGPYVYIVDDDATIKVVSSENRNASNREMRIVGSASTDFTRFMNICDIGAGVFSARTASCSPSRILAPSSRIAVVGNLLLEANAGDGFVIYRIGQPTRSREVAHLPAATNGNFGSADNGLGLAMKGRNLVNAGRTGVGLYRVDNPAVPITFGELGNTNDHHVMDLVGDTIFLARDSALEQYRFSSAGGTLALATSEGWRLQTLSTISYGNTKSANAIHVRWPFAYLLLSNESGQARTGNELKVINLRTGLVTATVALPDGSGFRDGSIAYHRNRLYVTRSTGPNITIVNIASRGTPSATLGSVAVSSVSGAVVQGTQLFTGGFNVTRIFDLTSVDAPALLGSISAGGSVLAATGNFVYSSTEPRPVIIDATDPSAARLVAAPGRLRLEEGVLVVGKHVFMQDRDELSIVELQ